MKVLLINGSPHEKGTTYTALKKAADTLEGLGIEAEIFHVEKLAATCIDCRVCKKKQNNRCALTIRSTGRWRRRSMRTDLSSARRCITRLPPG